VTNISWQGVIALLVTPFHDDYSITSR